MNASKTRVPGDGHDADAEYVWKYAVSDRARSEPGTQWKDVSPDLVPDAMENAWDVAPPGYAHEPSL